VSPDKIRVGRRSLVLVRHGTGYHLVVLLPHNVSSPLSSSVLKPNLYYVRETRRNAHVIMPRCYCDINIIGLVLPVTLVWKVQSFEPAVSSPWRLGFD